MSSPPESVEDQRTGDADGAVDEAILRDVEAALAAVADVDIDLDDPADLERVRRVLPTEPRRARVTELALPPPLADAFEYVSASQRQDAYWRRSRERRDPEALTPAELRERIAFAEAAMAQAGNEGVVITEDGRRIPASARRTGDAHAGRSFTRDGELTDAEADRGRELLNRIRSFLEP